MAENNGLNVLEQIKEFESSQESRLEKAKIDSETKVKMAEEDAQKKLQNMGDSLCELKKDLVAKAEQEAESDAKKIVDKYRQMETNLVTQAEKNYDKAVEAVFETLFER